MASGISGVVVAGVGGIAKALGAVSPILSAISGRWALQSAQWLAFVPLLMGDPKQRFAEQTTKRRSAIILTTRRASLNVMSDTNGRSSGLRREWGYRAAGSPYDPFAFVRNGLDTPTNFQQHWYDPGGAIYSRSEHGHALVPGAAPRHKFPPNPAPPVIHQYTFNISGDGFQELHG